MAVNAAMLSSARDSWNTPANIVEVVRRIGGGRIGIDPCSNADSIVGAEIEYRLPEVDGLAMPWGQPPGVVYVNPPYGREIGPWVERCFTQARLHGVEVVALVPARVDTRWFDWCWRASAICFVSGRLTFLGAPSPAPFPSALVYWGTWREHFEAETRSLGKVVFP